MGLIVFMSTPHQGHKVKVSPQAEVDPTNVHSLLFYLSSDRQTEPDLCPEPASDHISLKKHLESCLYFSSSRS